MLADKSKCFIKAKHREVEARLTDNTPASGMKLIICRYVELVDLLIS
jgi:hypothetical protein